MMLKLTLSSLLLPVAIGMSACSSKKNNNNNATPAPVGKAQTAAGAQPPKTTPPVKPNPNPPAPPPGAKPPVTPPAGQLPSLTGTWSLDCTLDQTDDSSSKSTFQYLANGTFISNYTVYEDDECLTGMVRFTLEGNFALTGATPNVQGTYNIDYTGLTLQATLIDTSVDYPNPCSTATPQTYIDDTVQCPYANQYDIVDDATSYIVFGDKTGANNGSTQALRPTALDGNQYYPVGTN